MARSAWLSDGMATSSAVSAKRSGAARCIGATLRKVTTVTDEAAAARGAWGAGLATFDKTAVCSTRGIRLRVLGLDGSPLASGTMRLDRAVAADLLAEEIAATAGPDDLRGVEVAAVATAIDDLDEPPDTHDVWLRLHLLSHRLVRPNGQSLEGIFGLLTNVAWTNLGPVPIEQVDAVRRASSCLRHSGCTVHAVDKFPRMTDYVVPSGVRIADADRVRMGAHLAEGTTVMHAGFVNFNAGTLGEAMVEGRISQGVMVGTGADIGAGASIMGTLSGGGTEVISIGERTLIGANGGVGTSLGDDCVVEAGLYITKGTLVTLPDGATVKAGSLSGEDGLLFLRNSTTGVVEVRARAGRTVALNPALHAN